ncbi:hypothetical protein Goshw_012119, partial [Gossypium schwendimanii]|nr:hypothetical protein [Gossypium schwendimanii]
MIFQRKNRWRCFKIFKKRISNKELLGCFQMRSYINTQRMKRLVVGPMMTPEYIGWWGRSINDNVPGPSQGDSQQTGKRLRVIPFELEIIRQYFERRNSELEKK